MSVRRNRRHPTLWCPNWHSSVEVYAASHSRVGVEVDLRSLITHPHYQSTRLIDIEDIENPLIAVPAASPSKGLCLPEASGVNRVDHLL